MYGTLLAPIAISGLIFTGTLALTSAAAETQRTPILKSELQGERGLEATIYKVEAEPGWETERHMSSHRPGCAACGCGTIWRP
jgi:hypothetical protein